MQKMVAHWNLHQFLVLLEIFQAEVALLLQSHVGELVSIFNFLPRHQNTECDSFHDVEIGFDNRSCLGVVVQHHRPISCFLIKLAIATESALPTDDLLALCEEKADDFDEQ